MSGSRSCVFVIDDSDVSLMVISAALEGAGFDVHAFNSAFVVPAQIVLLKPAVIVIDLLMPALGGDKVVDVLRRNAQHQCPIIIYSGAPEPELRARTMACGADAYVRKTHDITPLVRLVRERAGASW
jgi:CheY-like chemotaxis protein